MLACRLNYEELCNHLEDVRSGNTFVPTGGDNVAITGIPTLFTGRQADAEHHCLLNDFCCSSEQHPAAVAGLCATAAFLNVKLPAREGSRGGHFAPCREVQRGQKAEIIITLTYKSLLEVENTIFELYETVKAGTNYSDQDLGQLKAMLGIDMGVDRQACGKFQCFASSITLGLCWLIDKFAASLPSSHQAEGRARTFDG